MRERLRSLVGKSASRARVLRESYLKNGGGLNIEERYGKAVADINAQQSGRGNPRSCRSCCASIRR